MHILSVLMRHQNTGFSCDRAYVTPKYGILMKHVKTCIYDRAYVTPKYGIHKHAKTCVYDRAYM
jgi:hypothetical protein